MFKRLMKTLRKTAMPMIKGLYKKFREPIKEYARKAIGYVRGLDGDKLATLGAGYLATAAPPLAPLALGISPIVGGYINKGIDWVGNEGINQADEWLSRKRSHPE